MEEGKEGRQSRVSRISSHEYAEAEGGMDGTRKLGGGQGQLVAERDSSSSHTSPRLVYIPSLPATLLLCRKLLYRGLLASAPSSLPSPRALVRRRRQPPSPATSSLPLPQRSQTHTKRARTTAPRRRQLTPLPETVDPTLLHLPPTFPLVEASTATRRPRITVTARSFLLSPPLQRLHENLRSPKPRRARMEYHNHWRLTLLSCCKRVKELLWTRSFFP